MTANALVPVDDAGDARVEKEVSYYLSIEQSGQKNEHKTMDRRDGLRMRARGWLRAMCAAR